MLQSRLAPRSYSSRRLAWRLARLVCSSLTSSWRSLTVLGPSRSRHMLRPRYLGPFYLGSPWSSCPPLGLPVSRFIWSLAMTSSYPIFLRHPSQQLRGEVLRGQRQGWRAAPGDGRPGPAERILPTVAAAQTPKYQKFSAGRHTHDLHDVEGAAPGMGRVDKEVLRTSGGMSRCDAGPPSDLTAFDEDDPDRSCRLRWRPRLLMARSADCPLIALAFWSRR